MTSNRRSFVNDRLSNIQPAEPLLVDAPPKKRTRIAGVEVPPEVEPPSKSQRKAQMHEIQTLGEKLMGLKEAYLRELELPESLFDALMEAKRIKSHEALRRQRQLIGKLMRYADVPAIEQYLLARNFGK